MTNKMESLTDSELCELIALIVEIKLSIKNYIHVSNLLPSSITLNIGAYNESLLKELDKRQL